MEKGFVQVYTGDGKGKTTAAIGLAIRAAGAGLKTYFAQFLKKWDYSELKGLKRYSDMIAIEQFGSGEHIVGNPEPADIRAAENGMASVRTAMASGKYDIVVMDEAGVAEWFGVVKTSDLLDLMKLKPPGVELVITGRAVSGAVLASADLVTEMKMICHYYNDPVCLPARKGIEN
jgi:cob(I)alamin adenosyltransferase